MKNFELFDGNSLDVLKTFEDNSFDSIVTDPPYELNFMNKGWDRSGIANNVDLWIECLRVLKPGGHLLAFSGSRTYHRMTCAIEDAGFEIRDQIMWIYGSGFPKSLNISKAIDNSFGKQREVVSDATDRREDGTTYGLGHSGKITSNIPITEEAKKYDGWGTALKPAHEPICVARKPLSEKTVAANVLKWGTGGINIEDCRVGNEVRYNAAEAAALGTFNCSPKSGIDYKGQTVEGRHPANLIHDGSDEVVSMFPYTKSGRSNGDAVIGEQSDNIPLRRGKVTPRTDDGSASRFFYTAKASKKDKEEGLNDKNIHPTVKPTSLMQYLVRLVTPKRGKVLDPFLGSGSTGKACMYEGFDFVGIDLSPEYVELARTRIQYAKDDMKRTSYGLF